MKPSRIATTLLLLVTTLSAVATTPLNRVPTQLDTAYTENPNVYLYGTIIEGTIISERQDGLGDGVIMQGTNLRFQPAHTFLLYSEAVMFCNDLSDTFNEMGKVLLVVTYRKHARRLVDGVPCHDFVSVDYVATKAQVDAAKAKNSK
jgi:hypothetical protein